MITLTTCFQKLVDLQNEMKLVSDRLNWSNGHRFFCIRLNEIQYAMDIYQMHINAHRTGWWNIKHD